MMNGCGLSRIMIQSPYRPQIYRLYVIEIYWPLLVGDPLLLSCVKRTECHITLFDVLF